MDSNNDPLAEQARDPDDDPLTVEVIGGRLLISIGVRTLAFAIAQRPGEEDEDWCDLCDCGEMPLIRITDPLKAAKEIVHELSREEEDGTTEVHKLLDKAAFDAWENGGEGFAYDD
jgi:hypothetical protein